jgi:hypothetical protein
MSTEHQAERPSPEAIAGMLQIARYHREHERYHSLTGLENAAALRRDANALKVLADTWLRAAERPRREIDYSADAFRAAGCEDLSDPSAVATTGILFMEGEGEPRELTQLKGKLWAISETMARVSGWLAEKMEAGWEREMHLLTPELADSARPRFMALTRTTMSGVRFGVAARLMSATLEALNAVEFRPEALRKDLRGSAMLVRTAGWLLDEAAAVLAEQAADLTRSDPDWTDYIAALEGLAGGSQEPDS